ncbi:unnamed protein product [Cylindrotheca closterium]|uniref:Uncharacterized protein n=1 Tax=Cylindrotheca closterium TaxID=2856 RepID=A0AAD2JL47_9STRA|nr:unnamed protein product [Cylindrotheca closterium]
MVIQRFDRRIIPDHRYTRRNRIVSNIVNGGKCLFLGDFPTFQESTVSNNKVTYLEASRILQEQKMRDVVLLQGNIYSKAILLQYTSTPAGRVGRASQYCKNPTGNGKTFLVEDVQNAPFALTGKELLDYAIRSSGEDPNAIFPHEVKIILEKDLQIKVDEETHYSLLWYVTKLESASSCWVEDADAAFNDFLNSPDRDNEFIGPVELTRIFVSFFIAALLLLLPGIVSKLVLQEQPSPSKQQHEDEVARAEEALVDAKLELEAKIEELKDYKEVIQRLHGENEQSKYSIAIWKASIEVFQKRQRELMQDRNTYRSMVWQAEQKVAWSHPGFNDNNSGEPIKIPEWLTQD